MFFLAALALSCVTSAQFLDEWNIQDSTTTTTITTADPVALTTACTCYFI